MRSITRTREPDVPQDVSPVDGPQSAPPLRGFQVQREWEQATIRTKDPVATRPIQNTVRPAQPERTRERDPLPDKERERKRRREGREGKTTVEYYGMADTFARQIAVALAEPEAVTPLPIDWDRFVAGGKDFGTKPLATRKIREERHRQPR
ncbi:hypothetical protein C8Q76DRAFT_703882 [Earliella scabrosa]|nr:hypothetical protein C8Q76DRAFT_703882 [Earliella scabrosa]